jgi:hypothetical protein
MTNKFSFLKLLAEQTMGPPTEAPAGNRLTDTQKMVLLAIHTSPTPETAYQSVLGSQQLISARNQLKSMGLILMNDSEGRAAVSDEGAEVLANSNMTDDIGEITQDGEALLQRMPQNQTKESMNRLKALS